MSSPQTTSDLQAVVAALRANDHFLVVTHENPDGDALGSMLAMTSALRQLGKDAVMYLGGNAPGRPPILSSPFDGDFNADFATPAARDRKQRNMNCSGIV